MSFDGRKSLGELSLRDIFPVAQTSSPPPDESQFYEELAAKCEKMCKRLGTRGQGFKTRRDALLRTAPDVHRMISVMQGASFIRPLIDLWQKGHPTVDIPCTPELLDHLDKLACTSRRRRLGRLALRELCQFFFSRYDTLPHLSALCRVLRHQFSLYQMRELLFGLDKFKAQEKLFLQAEGHAQLARLTEAHDAVLADEAKAHGIPLTDSRFFEASQHVYYLSRLRKLHANEQSDLLAELQMSQVHESRLSGSKRLGHEVLVILIDTLRNAHCSPSESWRDTLLTIAGDPRVPKTSRSYMDWWAHIDASYAETMCEWLAEVDMELFLRIWQEYAQREGGAALQRMYPDRACFLRGIFQKKLVRGTRLFLGTDAKSYLTRTCRGQYRPHSIPILGSQSKDLAVFYLNLGKAHIIEGTHNFKLKILSKIPQNSALSGYRLSTEQSDFKTGLKSQYEKAFGEGGYFEKVHLGHWQRDAVAHLRKLGISLLESEVTPKESFYRNYR
ncbi:EH signature domain-containing protein [Desulfovibrio piger]|uniref:EH signature domain-containing protein n=1 Tax=Desulfovibrio piger TaxID=901 RepID=UPI00243274D7|nr:EH signature domain-containing protein [Desulfovibrio piger]